MAASAQAELSSLDDLMSGFTERLQSGSKFSDSKFAVGGLIDNDFIGSSPSEFSGFVLSRSQVSSFAVGTSVYSYINAISNERDSLSPTLDEEFNFHTHPSYPLPDYGSSLVFSSYADTESNPLPVQSLWGDKVDHYTSATARENMRHGVFFTGQYFSDTFTFSKKLSDVPDPGSFLLLGLGVLALALVRRKSAQSFI